MTYVIVLVVLIGLAWALYKIGVRRTTIFEYETGLVYRKGIFKEIRKAGQYWYVPFFTHIQKVDIRPVFVSITGQEVLSSDGVTLKVSLAAKYKITDPGMAVNKINNYRDALYLELQSALREIVGNTQIDELIGKRNEFSDKMMEMSREKVNEYGLDLISVTIKDIMFPGDLKRIFAQVVAARKEGQAKLEKARGETAALRNLANAAKMIESNPNLMQLRMIQALGESSGNTLVLGMPPQSTIIPQKKTADSSEEKT